MYFNLVKFVLIFYFFNVFFAICDTIEIDYVYNSKMYTYDIRKHSSNDTAIDSSELNLLD